MSAPSRSPRSSSPASSSSEEQESDDDLINTGDFQDAMSRVDTMHAMDVSPEGNSDDSTDLGDGAHDANDVNNAVRATDSNHDSEIGTKKSGYLSDKHIAQADTQRTVGCGDDPQLQNLAKLVPESTGEEQKSNVQTAQSSEHRDAIANVMAKAGQIGVDQPPNDILSIENKTALPEGCFQLTKINDAGLKVSVLARANDDGEMEILDDDDVKREEFLGDIDEVIENLERIKLEENALPGKDNTLELSKSTQNLTSADSNGNLHAQKLTDHKPLIRTRSHRRDRQMLSSLTLSQTISAHVNAIWKLCFEPVLSFDTQILLATGGQDKVVRVWTCKVLRNHTSSSSTVVSDDSSSVDLSEHNGWEISESPFREYFGHKLDVVDLAWSPQRASGGRYLLSASLDKSVRLWHTSKASICLCVFAHPKCVTSVDFHPSAKRLRFVSGSFDSKVRIWDIESGNVTEWKQVQNRVTSCCFRPDGNMVCAGLMNGVVVFLHTNGLKFYTQVECRNRRGKYKKGRKVTGVVYSPVIDKKSGTATLLVSTNDSRLRAFRTTDFAQVMKYKGLRNDFLQITACYSPDGSTIMSGSEDGKVLLWRAAHDWYNPSSATARLTGYNKVKNNSYECFEATGGNVCTATGFLPCVSSPKELAELSAAKKLAAGTISRFEYEKVVQMLERDTEDLHLKGESFSSIHDVKGGTMSFHGIVTADYQGQIKLFCNMQIFENLRVKSNTNSHVEKASSSIVEEDDTPSVPKRPADMHLPSVHLQTSPPALPPKPQATMKKKKSTRPILPPRPTEE